MTSVRDTSRAIRRIPEIIKWAFAPEGRPSPAPYKRAVIRRYAKIFRTPILVQTGTLLGRPVMSELGSFRRIVSIEINSALAPQARPRSHEFDHEVIQQGDIASELSQVLPSLSAPTLFWLGGHSSGECAVWRSDPSSTILTEVETILSAPLASIVLIDDARHFVGRAGYPTLERLFQTVASLRPSATVSLSRDIVRIEAMQSWDVSSTTM